MMKEKIEKLIERFPDHERVIKALAGSNTRFRDLVQDHYDVHHRLSSDDAEQDPSTYEYLESRHQNLEEELIRLIQGYPLA
jgi:uncharacterized protein YdcH (DUF465 family)